MCKKCVEYKSFDELPEELKEKFKSGSIGSNFIRAKDGYIGFINSLNQQGDKLVGVYVGTTSKTQVKFGKCGHVAVISPANYKNGLKCGVCHGKQVQQSVNDLATLHPDLAKEWHPTKNGELTPLNVTQSSGKRAWWYCDYGHEWESIIANRVKGSGCPYCSNKKVLKGFNDIATTHSQYIKYFINIEDTYTHTYSSSKKVELKCPDCGHIKNMRISDLTKRSYSCDLCSDGISYPEKLVGSILIKLSTDFIKQWSYNNGEHRYDFFLPNYNSIIETHGLQHYKEMFKNFGKTLEKEQENDRFKKQMALENGIRYYHIVDCRYSTLEWCRPNIERTLSSYIDMSILTDNDWREADIQAQKSLKIEVCKYWKEHKEIDNELTTKQVADIFGCGIKTVRDYLKWGNMNGLCTYETNGMGAVKLVYLIKPNGDKWFEEALSMNELAGVSGISLSAITRNVDKGALKYSNNAKYDPKYIGSRIVSAEAYDNQHQSNQNT